jgi:hypothetical protein
MPVPVQIISDFLGAGKISAIQTRLLARRGGRTAVIVNDFGEAALEWPEGEGARASEPAGCAEGRVQLVALGFARPGARNAPSV